jgi:predicted O-methyltransferase YrrM
MQYDLSHPTQPDHQNFFGPIQDDEALFLYSLVRCCRISTILEIGGGTGYSALNFLKSIQYAQGKVYTVDINPVPKLANNHKVITKDIKDLKPEDLDNCKIDLIFFDCHNISQLEIYFKMLQAGIADDQTILILHDTNLHYAPYAKWGHYVSEEDGYAHQPVEVVMANYFKEIGYDVFSIRTNKSKHSEQFPVRHGLSICRKFKKIKII